MNLIFATGVCLVQPAKIAKTAGKNVLFSSIPKCVNRLQSGEKSSVQFMYKHMFIRRL
jgi:hypothetical protein